jgi:hypothetical protein
MRRQAARAVIRAAGPGRHHRRRPAEREVRRFRSPGIVPAVNRFTHLGRTLDPRIPSNLVALAATLATALGVVAIGHGVDAVIPAGGGAFLAWMIGREIDPDRVATANVSAVATSALMLTDPSAAPGALVLAGVGARVISRSTGKPPTAIDLAVLLAGSLLVSPGLFSWVAAVALAVAVVLDARWDADLGDEEPAGRRMLWGAAMGVVSLVAAGITSPGGWEQPPGWMWAIVGAGAMGGLVVSRFEPIRSTADLTREPLDPDRVRAARVLVLGAAGVGTVVGGAAGLMGFAPAWIALAVAGLNRAIATGATEPLLP